MSMKRPSLSYEISITKHPGYKRPLNNRNKNYHRLTHLPTHLSHSTLSFCVPFTRLFTPSPTPISYPSLQHSPPPPPTSFCIFPSTSRTTRTTQVAISPHQILWFICQIVNVLHETMKPRISRNSKQFFCY